MWLLKHIVCERSLVSGYFRIPFVHVGKRGMLCNNKSSIRDVCRGQFHHHVYGTTTFMRSDPKSAKRQSSHQCLFGYALTKAACKMLVKLTQSVFVYLCVCLCVCVCALERERGVVKIKSVNLKSKIKRRLNAKFLVIANLNSSLWERH